MARDQLGAAVAELEVAAKDSLRPAAWVRRNPYVWIGGAFVLGLALGWSGGEHAR